MTQYTKKQKHNLRMNKNVGNMFKPKKKKKNRSKTVPTSRSYMKYE